MDRYQTMMEARGDFIGWICSVLYLEADIANQVAQLHADLRPCNADILVRSAKTPAQRRWRCAVRRECRRWNG